MSIKETYKRLTEEFESMIPLDDYSRERVEQAMKHAMETVGVDESSSTVDSDDTNVGKIYQELLEEQHKVVRMSNLYQQTYHQLKRYRSLAEEACSQIDRARTIIQQTYYFHNWTKNEIKMSVEEGLLKGSNLWKAMEEIDNDPMVSSGPHEDETGEEENQKEYPAEVLWVRK